MSCLHCSRSLAPSCVIPALLYTRRGEGRRASTSKTWRPLASLLRLAGPGLWVWSHGPYALSTERLCCAYFTQTQAACQFVRLHAWILMRASHFPHSRLCVSPSWATPPEPRTLLPGGREITPTTSKDPQHGSLTPVPVTIRWDLQA